jgi:AP-4 complex subunit epsilon-1
MVVDCLESKDETLKKLTLDLLYKITNSNNIEVISKKMLATLHSSTDPYFRQNLVNRICELAERFATSHQWHIDTMHILFEFGSEYISLDTLNNYLKLVADNYKEDNEFGALIIQSNMSLLERVQPTDLIIKMISWIFGEIGSNVYGSDS